MTMNENTYGVREETYRGYLWLLEAANYSGYVCRSQAALTRDLGLSKKTLASLLSELEFAKLIEIRNPLPFLVLRLPLWSDKRPKLRTLIVEKVPDSSAQKLPEATLPLNRYPSSSSNAAANINRSGEGVQGEGDLVDEVAAATGWTDRAEMEALLTSHSPPVVRKVLARLAQVPDSQIRSSRIALFRFLLKKFAQDKSNAHDLPTHHNSTRRPTDSPPSGTASAANADRSLALPGASVPA